jgi:GT2 family glycosyltransferase/glycosyltransferase involved in cell wall biosynthesis
LDANPDVAEAGMNPLVHYLAYGKAERRGLYPASAPRLGSSRAAASAKKGLPAGQVKRDQRQDIQRQTIRFDEATERTFLQGITQLLSNDSSPKADLVSIIMPTYNRADRISRAIESVLSQEHQNWQLLIIDDGSCDATREVVAPYAADHRVRYLPCSHRGVSAARNTGLRRAEGTVVAYLDSDNAWEPHFLRVMTAFLRFGDLSAAYSGIRAHGDEGETRFFRGAEFDWDRCLRANYIDINSFCHVRSAASDLSFDETLRRLVDWDFILRLTSRSRTSYAPFVGVRYYDGANGNRITNTEYIGPELADATRRIRAKHADADDPDRRHPRFRPQWPEVLGKQRRNHEHARGEIELVFFPDYRATNPYQTLLYGRLSAEMIRAVPGDLDDAFRRQRESDGVVVFHLHWTSPIVTHAPFHVARSRVETFLTKLTDFVRRGGVFVWTIHNIIPHESAHVELEIHLCQALARLAKVIHVHSVRALELAKPYYDIPEHKVLVASHGAYRGVYPDSIARQEARRQLGIHASQTLFVSVGQVRAYKGHDDLLDAFDTHVRLRPNSSLIIAGKPLQIDCNAIRERATAVPNVRVELRYLDDDELQVYLRAADFAVLPYRSILTSGSVYLALSFGVPVIAPIDGLIEDAIRDGTDGLLYSTVDQGSLERALNDAAAMDAASRARMRSSAATQGRMLGWDHTQVLLARTVWAAAIGEPLGVDVGNVRRNCFIRRPTAICHIRPRVAAIVLHYNQIEDTVRGVDSLLAQEGEPCSIYIVSNDESGRGFQTLAERFPQCTIVQSPDNLGYAGGNNIGIAIARDAALPYVWIVNPDVVAPPDFLRSMLKAADSQPDCAIFGSKILFGHRPEVVWFAGGQIEWENGLDTTHKYIGAPTTMVPAEPIDCDYVTGASLLFRSELIDAVGFLPEEYFLYFEETHWCTIARRLGYQSRIFPNASLYHFKRSEDKGVPTSTYLYYYCRGALLMCRHFRPEKIGPTIDRLRALSAIWLSKVKAARPGDYTFATFAVERGIQHGSLGIGGRVDLMSEFRSTKG